MSTIIETERTENAIVPKEGGNISCTALIPNDVEHSQRALIAWCRDKIELVKSETAEFVASYQHAKSHKWATRTLKKHADLSSMRVVYYEKMLAALESGFVIVPNFPIALFAIRTERKSPVGNPQNSYQWSVPDYEQSGEFLPIGAGEYQNPLPEVFSEGPFLVEGKTEERFNSYPIAWRKLEFPVSMAKVEIMRSTEEAMKLKIFDQFGILPETSRAGKKKVDPLIVGQLNDPRGRVVTFMIAWHLDTSVL